MIHRLGAVQSQRREAGLSKHHRGLVCFRKCCLEGIGADTNSNGDSSSRSGNCTRTKLSRHDIVTLEILNIYADEQGYLYIAILARSC